MSTFLPLKQCVSLVTGGASGLGRATAERFARAGSKVVIMDLPSSDGAKVAEEIGQNCIFAPADVTNEQDVSGVMNKIVEKFTALHVLVNCAGIGVAKKTYSPEKDQVHPLSLFHKVIKVNVVGLFNVSKQAARLMNENPDGLTKDDARGVIINTASVAAFDGQIGQAAYASSKGAIASMTLPMARDLFPRGLRVITIAPGIFKTPLMLSLPEKARKSLEKQVPFPKRLGDPSEFATLCQTIVENPYINGEIVRLDGALRMG